MDKAVRKKVQKEAMKELKRFVKQEQKRTRSRNVEPKRCTEHIINWVMDRCLVLKAEHSKSMRDKE